MSKIIFTDEAWEEFIYWQTGDKKTTKRIFQLIKDIDRNAFEGIGKPEPLKNNLSGCWSRRIDEANRLIYKVTPAGVEIIKCKGHYED